jgi:glucose/arabinose dehydrogenase
MELRTPSTAATELTAATPTTNTGLIPLQGTAAANYLRVENFLQTASSNNSISQADHTWLVAHFNSYWGSDPTTPDPAAPTNPGTGSGLTGTYFTDPNLQTIALTRVDPLVNFNWWRGAPDTQMGSDQFSVRWTGFVQPLYSENYTFYTKADDGVRLWVNDILLVDQWSDQSVFEHQGQITLEAGKKYAIQLDYYENQYEAVARLLWSSESQIKQVIPTSQLYAQGEDPELPKLAIASASRNEEDADASELLFTVSLSAASTSPVSVNYATADGTATATADYIPKTGTLTFAPGETTQTISIAILGDAQVEPDETFALALSNPTNATLDVAQATGTILNDDQPQALPTLSIDSVTITEGNSGTTNAVFTVTLSGSTDSPVNVNYATANDTAIASADYTATTGSLTFLPNERSKTIEVPILGDIQVEPNETFVVNLTNPTSATLATAQGIGTITNDDVATVPLPTSVSLVSFGTGFIQPVDIVNAQDASGRLFVVEQPGTIRIVQNGAPSATPFLDIRDRVKSGGEEGLLSLAFPPEYTSKGYFYVYYTNADSNIVVSRFRVSAANPNIADASSEQILLTIPHPTFTNHNGGKLAFGADGYLYISVGDGGGGGDPNNNAQNPAVLLGKLLRIDVETPSATAPYLIPNTNPFAATTDPNNLIRDEIWALGLRNPWRISFDRATGDLYIADVGQGVREEVNRQLASSLGGQNYGWKILEGTVPYSPGSTTGLTGPWLEYDHSAQGGFSITGGYVYRGQNYPSLQGIYFYGDFVNGKIWGAQPTATGGVETRLLLDSPYGVSSFGESESGELYVADYFGGSLYQVTP